ncbi:ABC transporter ATP-binding protein [Lentilactobacillus otakiensis]|uniref:Iron complex transport system ATP-binding protein n=1 Tax=Lentilactobacillus otakiensis DSM 19908 = JCM 15040 TaxID=1423780 RepID=S4NU57_9LACO|nr:ABC transporter ATP-binding protein [Lentilactobacillus otakiensis]KRL11857.1 iron-chelate-transporting ATPase [Lentilactobacillus otakiensis DSM 19908 = JCM 15040]MBZ3776022.1 ABC transporter ATP-binding protein [Lentilactobacillus otakiensis]MDV3519197.1 ABC transporter ATP-binding protein [Lentilactobacillus otakiensis]GAD17498.1 iron complex transport system ATP-binding protein [Lentilactobacillus otakiensis DSM 19908 = JCM 15040]
MDLNQVSYHYPQQPTLLSNISAKIPTGGILSIIGPNGAGKSTLLKLMAGIIQPSAGEVLLDGRSIATIPRKQLATKIAVVSQQNDIFDDMKVIDVVKTGRLAHHNLLATIADDEVANYIHATHLDLLAQRPLSSLSGGQRQRVWLASALAQDPEYLLLDEPTTYLDIHYQAELMAILKQLNEQKHISIIMVLHDINQAFKISHQLWLVKQGRLIKTGRPAECYDRQLLASIFETNIQIVDVPNYGKYIVEIPDDEKKII